MNVLMVSTVFPYPARHGGALRVWHVLREVAKRHRVVFLAMHTPQDIPAPEHIEALHEWACGVRLVERPVGLPRRAMHGLRSMAGRQPYTLANFLFPEFGAAISQMLRGNAIDLVHAHFLHTAQYYPLFEHVARYFDCHNLNDRLWSRYADAQPRFLPRRVFARRQAHLMKRLEPEVHRHYDAVSFCSEEERNAAMLRSPEACAITCPNGVDWEYFTPWQGPETPETLAFCASMDATQNIDGTCYFVQDVFPHIIRQKPNARLLLVGRAPVRRVQALASPGVIVTGTVDDVRPYVGQAQVVVAPLRIGGGTRLKILEAMAMGKAVVSTTIGAEGLDCTHGHDICLADTPGDMANAIMRLMDDAEERNRLGEAARKMVKNRYGWEKTGVCIEAGYTKAMARFDARKRAKATS